jgi:hypothetical protein
LAGPFLAGAAAADAPSAGLEAPSVLGAAPFAGAFAFAGAFVFGAALVAVAVAVPPSPEPFSAARASDSSTLDWAALASTPAA